MKFNNSIKTLEVLVRGWKKKIEILVLIQSRKHVDSGKRARCTRETQQQKA